jgi:hypothetical protein
MRNGNSGMEVKGRRGNALLGLIAILVLVGVVIGVQRYLKSRTPDPDTALDLTPWKEWRIREQSKKPVPELLPEQPKITGMLKYEANVELPKTSAAAGEITMWISSEGQVGGTWAGNFYNEKKVNYDVQNASFEGKVCPGKIYQDDKGQDPSKLYFIAKGKFIIHSMTADAKKYHILGGDIYVKGWLNHDLSVASEIIITSNEKYSESFAWKTVRPIRKD